MEALEPYICYYYYYETYDEKANNNNVEEVTKSKFNELPLYSILWAYNIFFNEYF